MKKISAAIVLALLLTCLSAPSAQAVAWIDWTSTTAGTLTSGSSTVGVTMTGTALDYVNGDTYYNNVSTGGTSPTGTYMGLTPTDLIRVANSTTFTLVFDAPVVDLYMALVSVGASAIPVVYNFNTPFTVESFGPNYWGYAGYSVSGNSLTGTEFNGILKLNGTFNSITFSTQNYEFWHGFNFGIASAAKVPEPSTLLMLGSAVVGMGGLGFARRRFYA